MTKPIYTGNYPSMGGLDKQALRQLVRSLEQGPKRILEIGSWLGQGSTQVFMQELQHSGGYLYCIDTWEGSLNVERHQAIRQQYDLFNTFLYNIQKIGDFYKNVYALRMPSVEAARVMADQMFDLIFIDGDHSYESTSADIAAWKDKVSPVGILAGHDCELRVTKDNRAVLEESCAEDNIPSLIPTFLVNHPGVILAVNNAFGDDVSLFAEEVLESKDGSEKGASTIWYVRQ